MRGLRESAAAFSRSPGQEHGRGDQREHLNRERLEPEERAQTRQQNRQYL